MMTVRTFGKLGLGAGAIALVSLGVWSRRAKPTAEPNPTAEAVEAPAANSGLPSSPDVEGEGVHNILPAPAIAAPVAEGEVPPQIMAQIRSFASEAASATCENMEKCCSANRLTFTRANCQKQTEKVERETLVASVGKGEGLTYDARAAADCVEQRRIETRSCGDVSEAQLDRTLLACERVFSKALTTGAKCASRGDCALVPGKRVQCESPDGNGDPVCTARNAPRVGDACGPDAAASCGDAQDHLRCDLASKTCQNMIAVGGTCTDSSECADGAFCGGEGETKRCEALHAAGATCSTEKNDCSAKTYCDGTRCVARKAPGSECQGPDECASGVCGGEGRCLGNPIANRQSCGEVDG